MTDDKIKVCRQCHKTYDDFESDFCSNGCKYNPPYFVDGVENNSITPREVILVPNEEKLIRWVCIVCQTEFKSEDSKSTRFVCSNCDIKNDLYPFTFKGCANCKNEAGSPHKMTLDSNFCNYCGKSNFVINGDTLVSNLKTDHKKKIKEKGESQTKSKSTENLWDVPETFQIPEKKVPIDGEKNVISITFTILNNNCEYILYAKSKIIKLDDIIKDAKGFLPDQIYEKYINTPELKDYLFKIDFDEEAQIFYLTSPLQIQIVGLDSHYKPNEESETWANNSKNALTESKLLGIQAEFFKIRIWVY
jgi:hypothetical protein